MALELSGQYDAAIAEYETMFAADPRSTIVANNLASLLSEHRGDPASLDRAFTIASRLKGSDVPQFLDTLGWIYNLKAEYDQALPLVQSAAEKVPESGTYQYHLGITYKGLGQKERAIASLKKAVELLPLIQIKASRRARRLINSRRLTMRRMPPNPTKRDQFGGYAA